MLLFSWSMAEPPIIKNSNTGLVEYNLVFLVITIDRNIWKWIDLREGSRIIKRNDEYRRCE